MSKLNLEAVSKTLEDSKAEMVEMYDNYLAREDKNIIDERVEGLPSFILLAMSQIEIIKEIQGEELESRFRDVIQQLLVRLREELPWLKEKPATSD